MPHTAKHHLSYCDSGRLKSWYKSEPTHQDTWDDEQQCRLAQPSDGVGPECHQKSAYIGSQHWHLQQQHACRPMHISRRPHAHLMQASCRPHSAALPAPASPPASIPLTSALSTPCLISPPLPPPPCPLNSLHPLPLLPPHTSVGEMEVSVSD